MSPELLNQSQDRWESNRPLETCEWVRLPRYSANSQRQTTPVFSVPGSSAYRTEFTITQKTDNLPPGDAEWPRWAQKAKLFVSQRNHRRNDWRSSSAI